MGILEKIPNGSSASEKLQRLIVLKEGYQTIAIEQTKKSTPYHLVKYPKKLALVLGNESDGISSAALKVVDQKVEIPMFGINRSLNVLVSASAVIYHYLESTKTF